MPQDLATLRTSSRLSLPSRANRSANSTLMGSLTQAVWTHSLSFLCLSMLSPRSIHLEQAGQKDLKVADLPIRSSLNSGPTGSQGPPPLFKGRGLLGDLVN